MSAADPRPTIGRSIGALAAGFVVTAALSLGTDVVMHGTGVFPGWGEPMSNGLFAWATIYRVVFTVLGGYVTARLAPRRPMAHARWLGLIGVAAATAGAAATWNAGPAFGPHWYPLFLVVTALPCVWVGGLLWVRAARVTAA
jgi:peptidoglycan/LPS O-acetylase OafA/YrhL